MARKSKEQRTLETRQLLEAWEKAELTNDKRYFFIDEMLNSLERGKNLTTKQREWLDSLIKEGVPQLSLNNKQIIQKIESAIEIFSSLKSRDWQISVLRDLRARIIVYENLSEKQENMLRSLVLESEKIASGDVWRPDVEMIENLKISLRLYKGYDLGWRAVRPGLNNIYKEVSDFINGNIDILQERSANRLLEAVEVRLKKFKSPKFKVGDFVNYCEDIIYCISGVYVDNDGNIVNDWLTPNNTSMSIDQEKIKKIKKKDI